MTTIKISSGTQMPDWETIEKMYGDTRYETGGRIKSIAKIAGPEHSWHNFRSIGVYECVFHHTNGEASKFRVELGKKPTYKCEFPWIERKEQ